MMGDFMKRWIALQSDPKFCNFKWSNQLIFEAETLTQAKIKYNQFADKNQLPSADFVTFEEYENPYDKMERLNDKGDYNGISDSD